MKSASISIILLASSVFSSITVAEVWTVDLSRNGDYSAIQPAIDNAVDGDTIIVEQGVYIGGTETQISTSMAKRSP